MAVVTIKIVADILDTDRKGLLRAELAALDLVQTWADQWVEEIGAAITASHEVYVTVEPCPDTQPTKRGRKPRTQVPVQPLSHAAE